MKNSTNSPPKNVDEYIAGFPEEIRNGLEELRATIKTVAPDAEEGISYQMPAYHCHGPLVYFAVHKTHIGFYATPTGNAAFEKELSKYKIGKGSVQFPLDQPIPLPLVTRIVKFRIEENVAKAQKKK